MITTAMVARLANTYGGRARPQAYLDLAQEHLLHWMREEGLFDSAYTVFKGGTAMRKFQFGKAGRFSTDLDFWATSRDMADFVIGMLNDGFTHQGVTFGLISFTREGETHGRWWAEAPELGRTQEPSGIEFSFRHRFRDPRMPETRPDIPGVDASMGFAPVLVPVYDLLENVAEKLARTRSTPKARDLYDLALIGPNLTDRDLTILRRLTAWKVFLDVHEGRRVPIPFRGGPDYRILRAADIGDIGDIGRLAGRNWSAQELRDKLEQYYARMGEPTGDLEVQLARCGGGDRHWAESQMAEWDRGL